MWKSFIFSPPDVRSEDGTVEDEKYKKFKKPLRSIIAKNYKILSFL